MRRHFMLIAVALLGALLPYATSAWAPSTLTFSKDVALILYEHCVY